MNRKFCDGITKWQKNDTAYDGTQDTIKKLIMAWHSSNCSQQDEDNAWKVIQDNETLVMDYIKTWKGKMILNIPQVV